MNNRNLLFKSDEARRIQRQIAINQKINILLFLYFLCSAVISRFFPNDPYEKTNINLMILLGTLQAITTGYLSYAADKEEKKQQQEHTQSKPSP